MARRIAAVQCTSVSDPEKNKRALSVLISEAASQNADLVLLPEMCLSMNSDYYQELAEDSATLDWLAAQAATHSLWLVAGAVPQPAPGDDARVRSASLEATGSLIPFLRAVTSSISKHLSAISV